MTLIKLQDSSVSLLSTLLPCFIYAQQQLLASLVYLETLEARIILPDYGNALLLCQRLATLPMLAQDIGAPLPWPTMKAWILEQRLQQGCDIESSPLLIQLVGLGFHSGTPREVVQKLL
jgi:hypothetical protein